MWCGGDDDNNNNNSIIKVNISSAGMEGLFTISLGEGVAVIACSISCTRQPTTLSSYRTAIQVIDIPSAPIGQLSL